jgi:hypothetical protein
MYGGHRRASAQRPTAEKPDNLEKIVRFLTIKTLPAFSL